LRELGVAPRSKLFLIASMSVLRAATNSCALTLGFDSDCAHAGAAMPAQQTNIKAINLLKKRVKKYGYVQFIGVSLGCGGLKGFP